MGTIHREHPKNQNRYQACLAGIRGYGFLLVFCGHYRRLDRLAHPDTLRLNVLTALSSISEFAVPAFFVLSGYLIGGILYHTQDRKGYFRVFYIRRILRVFPVYYVTLLAIAAYYAIRHLPLLSSFWIQFLYIQNLVPGYAQQPHGAAVMSHFWSLAVEEQFYLLWPLVVWILRDRRKLIGAVCALIVVCNLVRVAAPLLSISAPDASYFTLTRADAILLGVLLNLMRESEVYRRLVPYAKWATLCGVIAMFLLAFQKGEAWSWTYAGKDIWIPLANFTAVAIMMAVMQEGSTLNKMCSQTWICWLGGLSYSLYVFHLTYKIFFDVHVFPLLCRYMRQSFASLTSAALAFCLTLALSIVSYRLIEGPIFNLKRHLQYGNAEAPTPISQSSSAKEPELVEIAS